MNANVTEEKKSLSPLIKIQIIIAIIALLVTIITLLQISPLIEKKDKLEKDIAKLDVELNRKTKC